MADPRVEELARVLTEYSLRLKKGDLMLLAADAVSADLIRACYRAAIRRGAHVETQVTVDGLDEIFFKTAARHQLQHVFPTTRLRARRYDAFLYLRSSVNTRALTNVDPKRMALATTTRKGVIQTMLRRSAAGQARWAITVSPTQAGAQEADMSLTEYEDFVYGAGHLEDPDPIKTWHLISRAQQALTNALNRAKHIRIVAEDTDLTFACMGRKWINCDGRRNFPDGEVFTGPVESSVTGHIRFGFPSLRQGRRTEGVFLEFERGKVVRAKAERGQDYLEAMLETDAGARRVGETAFGTNYNITRGTCHILFDEKIGGTFHLALGATMFESGGVNKSALHWDLICELRNGGKVYADEKLIQQNGRFLDKRFPGPRRRRAGEARGNFSKIR